MHLKCITKSNNDNGLVVLITCESAGVWHWVSNAMCKWPQLIYLNQIWLNYKAKTDKLKY